MSLFQRDEIIYSPINGMFLGIERVNDDVFSKKMMGDGIAILPEDGNVYAPFDGFCSATLDSNHAIGITSTNGTELIIHIGLETVKLKGVGFKRYVQIGDKIVMGQKLMKFDKKVLEKLGYDTVSILVVTNKTVSKRMNDGNKSIATESKALKVRI